MLGKNSRWSSIAIDNDYCPVRPLINEAECFANRSISRHSDGCFIDGVTRLDESNNVFYNIKWNVLRQYNKASATRHGFGHAPARNSCHVGNDYRNGGAQIVCSPQIDALSRLNGRQAWNHKYIVIGEVVVRRSVQKLHCVTPCARLGLFAKPCFTTALGYSVFVVSYSHDFNRFQP